MCSASAVQLFSRFSNVRTLEEQTTSVGSMMAVTGWHSLGESRKWL